MLSEGTLLSGGEKDRKIIAWDSLQNYKKITETKVKKQQQITINNNNKPEMKLQLPETAGGVRSIYPQRPGRNDGNIYVGTTRNNILEGSLQRRFNQVSPLIIEPNHNLHVPPNTQVVFGHGRQLWGLAVHPDDELFATAGHDKNIALWRRNKLVWSTAIQYECVSLAFHPFGIALAAGSSEGHLIVLNAETGAPVATVRVCGSPLSAISYNPAGDMIAIASQNGSVYLFRVSRDGSNYKKSNKIRGGPPLTQLDWSSDGNYLQTTTADYDLVYCRFYVFYGMLGIFSGVFRGCESAAGGEKPVGYEGCQVVYADVYCWVYGQRRVEQQVLSDDVPYCVPQQEFGS